MKNYNEDLRTALEQYRDRHNLTNTELSRRMGVGITQVSKYLNGKPEGDVERLESIAGDVLHNESRIRETAHALFDTPTTRSVANTCNLVRETNDVGLLFAPAGLGKTSGCRMYALQNLSTIMITATGWLGTSSGVSAALFTQIQNRSYPGNVPRSTWMAERLRGSGRLIIVDNAHKLRASAIGWLFDFTDETECPLLLVGNPELLPVIRTNDQWFSRIGVKRELRWPKSGGPEVVRKLVESLVPEAVEVAELAGVVAENHGHLRAVRKELLLARKIKETRPELKWEEAFRAAHTQLVRDYAL